MAEDGGRVPMSPGLQATLLRAREYAVSQSEAQVLLEHLLLALSEDADAAAVLESCQVDLSRLRHDVAGYIGSLDDRVPPGTPGAPAISPALTQVLKYATLAAQQGRRSSIDGAIVLAALVGDGRSMGASFLKAQGLTFEAAIRALREVAGRAGSLQPAPHIPETAPPPDSVRAPTSRADDILARARERVESRSGRTEPNGRAPRSERGATAEPPMPPREPIASASAAPMTAPSVPTEFTSATLEAATPSTSEVVPPVPAGEATVVSRPPAEPAIPAIPASDASAAVPQPGAPPTPAAPPAVELAPSPPSANQPPPPRPHPPQRPRTIPPTEPPARAETRNPSQPVAGRSPPAADGAQADAPLARSRPPAPDGWAAARQPQAGAGPRGGPGDPETAAARAAWPPAIHAPRAELPPAPHSPSFEPGPPQAYAPDPAASRLPAIDASLVSHSIPARLKQGRAQVVEVRIERPPLASPGSPSRSYALRPETVVARAIAVRLRPTAGRFIIEAGSPETQWDQGGAATGGGRFASEAAVWRFSVTPLGSGRGALQLTVSARTLGADGILAETQLPDQTFAVRVAAGHAGTLARIGLFLGITLGSMLILKLVEGVLGFDAFFFFKQLLRL